MYLMNYIKGRYPLFWFKARVKQGKILLVPFTLKGPLEIHVRMKRVKS
jgi:hypothetical protein